jgi:hypothetical protein
MQVKRTAKGAKAMELTYTQVGNLQIPNLVLDPEPMGSIGKYGRMRKRYLEEKKDGSLTALILSGKLTQHLLEINDLCKEQIEALTGKMAQAEGVTEQLKATDQMAWVQRMNSIRSRAEEIVMAELIYS